MMRFVDPIKATVVIDGDTVRCFLDRGWREDKRVDLRLFGLDTPEAKKTRAGGELEKRAGKLVGRVVQCWLHTRSDKQLYHTSDAKPKYEGRTIGRLIAGWPTHTDTDDCLNEYLLRMELCSVYAGKKREPWPHDELELIIARAEKLLAE